MSEFVLASAACSLLLLCTAGCATTSTDRRPIVRGEMNDAPAVANTTETAAAAKSSHETTPSEEATAFVTTTEPWKFGPFDGQTLVTPHYHVHTTLSDEGALRRVPIFVESALANYRKALGELPPPRKPMETYLFRTRSQWEAQMQQFLPDEADSFHNLGRGGLTSEGRSILYYIDRRGMSDTLAITAHEGWHQYTQTTFRQALPVWLEEGIATYMEGYVTRSDGAPSFRPWENRERFGALRDAVRRDRLIPLAELVSKRPQAFLEDGRRSLLTYYAQVWALTHFLAVGEGGKYRAGLENVIHDAANGTMQRRLMSSTAFTVHSRRDLNSDRVGPWVILEYFNRDMTQFEDEYNAFVNEIIHSRSLERMHNNEVFAGD